MMYETYGIYAGDKGALSPVVRSATRKEAARDRNTLLLQKNGNLSVFKAAVTTFPSGKVISQSIASPIS